MIDGLLGSVLGAALKGLLHLAAQADQLDVVVDLLGKGVSASEEDEDGRTPLFHARSRGVSHALLAAGADPHHRDALGQTPLHASAACGRVEVVHVLVQHGADAHAADHLGRTPWSLGLAADSPDVGLALLAGRSGRAHVQEQGQEQSRA